MPYVARDAAGRIRELRESPAGGVQEHLPAGDCEIAAFLGTPVAQEDAGQSEEIRSELAASDIELVRVIEDLVAVLIEKRVICMTDLPAAAQRKLSSRFSLRSQLQDLGGIVGEAEEVMLP